MVDLLGQDRRRFWTVTIRPFWGYSKEAREQHALTYMPFDKLAQNHTVENLGWVANRGGHARIALWCAQKGNQVRRRRRFKSYFFFSYFTGWPSPPIYVCGKNTNLDHVPRGGCKISPHSIPQPFRKQHFATASRAIGDTETRSLHNHAAHLQ